MVNKSNVVLCDGCKTRVATKKCFICDGDLCSYCRSKTDLYVGGLNLRHISDYCKNCLPKLKNVIKAEDEEDVIQVIREALNTHLRKKLIMEKLEEK